VGGAKRTIRRVRLSKEEESGSLQQAATGFEVGSTAARLRRGKAEDSVKEKLEAMVATIDQLKIAPT
jgi:hypothetical protein